MIVIDGWIAACTLCLAGWILLSGLDDLFLDATAFWVWVRRRAGPRLAATDPAPAQSPEQRIAIFLPLWQEDSVAAAMIEHSIAAVRYVRYAIFAGCYPNDPATLAAVRQASHRFPNVHVSLCPHDGPTSKADCLNWIHRRMLAYEAETGTRFDLVLVHDAEDIIHPDSLSLMNDYGRRFDMVQLPVLPLPTSLRELTHGVYCDEFAESHGKDLPIRQALGGFIPSAGVGTAYSRRAIDLLAASGEPFERDCLTEDYENGVRLRRAGATQRFLRIRNRNGLAVATREYFPRTVRQAVRQRTRWVAGIALQTWEKHGWGTRLADRYWFWRDRKGLAGNPASLLANLLFLYGAASGIWSCLLGVRWGLAEAMPHPQSDWLLAGTLVLLVCRTGIRAGCSAHVYGWQFAAGVPVRAVWANWINGLATLCAVAQYVEARIRRRKLEWRKTDHTYPLPTALAGQRRRLGEILASLQWITPEEVRSGLERADGLRLGEYLVRIGRLSEEQVCSALSLQRGIPYGALDLSGAESLRSVLPAYAAQTWKIVAYRAENGTLFVAGPEPPSVETEETLRRLTGMQIRFQLITPSEYQSARKSRAQAAGA